MGEGWGWGTRLTSADEVKESSGAGDSWQVVLSLDSRVHLQPVSGGSPVGAWWFLTSGQADVQRTWIKHMAHLTTDWRLCKVSNEIWGVISKRRKKKKRGWEKKIPFLSDVCDAALNMYDICVAWPEWLSRILLWLWQSKRRQVCQRISAVNEVESEWAAHYQPGISTKNYVTADSQVFIRWWKTPCGPGGRKIRGPRYFFRTFCSFRNEAFISHSWSGWRWKWGLSK